MALPHKDIVFPEVDLSDDGGDPRWRGEKMERGEDGYYHYRRPPGAHAEHWKHTRETWEEIVRAYEATPDDFRSAWFYLDHHMIYWKFYPGARLPVNHIVHLQDDYGFGSDSIVVGVSDVDGYPNVWLETGHSEMFPSESLKGQHTQWRDPALDVRAGTYEKAVVKLARLVWEKYGNDRRIADAPPNSA